MKSLIKVSALAMAVAVCVHVASADPITIPTSATLGSLVDGGGSLAIGDKTFDGFRFSTAGNYSFNASSVQVTASLLNDVYYLTWGVDLWLASAGPASGDLFLYYNVTATAPNKIWMIDQSYSIQGQASGGGFLSVDETVTALGGGDILANSHLDVGDVSDPSVEAGDNLIVNPAQPALSVTKHISFGVGNGGFFTIHEVSQSFHQVPDGGATVMFLGMAVSGLAWLNARRKS